MVIVCYYFMIVVALILTQVRQFSGCHPRIDLATATAKVTTTRFEPIIVSTLPICILLNLLLNPL